MRKTKGKKISKLAGFHALYQRVRKSSLVWASLLLFMAILNGCGFAKNAPTAESPPDTVNSLEDTVEKIVDSGAANLLIAAAASLKPVMEESLIPAFTKRHPDFTVTATYDSSGKLQTQLEEGLEADLFLSAATNQMDALIEEGLVDRTSVTMLLENQIVLIVSSGSENSFTEFADIQRASTIAIGDPDIVPAGQYAREALEHLDLWDSLEDRFSLGTNVTEVLNWVAEASADAGIVYATDAAATDRVKVIAAAPEGSLTKRVLYPAAILSGTANRDSSDLFLDYLKSAEAGQAFSSYGFIPLSQ